ncbi:MAG: hypothetical protein A3K03_05575, partial [Bdellovibrionales bacterium RIFOXYD1_FULL_44_7]
MSLATLLVIALGLSMDAFAVAIADGAAARSLNIKRALRLAFFFGLFQALMPIVGWLAGYGFRNLIMNVDHWVAFGLLALVGGKMIYESLKLDDNENNILNQQRLVVLLSLSIATSIDALAVGLSFSFLRIDIPFPAIVIGIVTFLVSFFGVYLGTKVGHFFEKKIAMIGGITLL